MPVSLLKVPCCCGGDVLGACCTPAGVCVQRTIQQCAEIGGLAWFANTDCQDVTCPPPPTDCLTFEEAQQFNCPTAVNFAGSGFQMATSCTNPDFVLPDVQDRVLLLNPGTGGEAVWSSIDFGFQTCTECFVGGGQPVQLCVAVQLTCNHSAGSFQWFTGLTIFWSIPTAANCDPPGDCPAQTISFGSVSYGPVAGIVPAPWCPRVDISYPFNVQNGQMTDWPEFVTIT